MGIDVGYRKTSYSTPQVPDYSLSRISELIPGILEKGKRTSEVNDRPARGDDEKNARPRVRLHPTNSERMNRALAELRPAAFKIHMLLWQWRGAPAKGYLPFFTVRSLSKFCSLTRPTVRAGLRELADKHWIARLDYDPHKKNELYRLVPIRDVPLMV